VVIVLLVLIFIIIVPAILTTINRTPTMSDVAAVSLLEGHGYVVFADDDYDTINAKMDALKVAADAATLAAQSAVVAAQLAASGAADAVDAAEIAASNAADAVIAAQLANNAAVNAAGNASLAVIAAQLAASKVDLFNTAERFLYPSTTQITCTLVAGNTGVFSDWALITDSVGGNFSSAFSGSTGYIMDMQIYDHSAVDKLYLVELSYGASKTILARAMWHTSFIDNVDIKSVLVPAGQPVYYRMMSSGANGANAKVGFRYIYE
jgi:hypothetical protein